VHVAIDKGNEEMDEQNTHRPWDTASNMQPDQTHHLLGNNLHTF
jgi:hypothetical protein